MLEGKCDEAEGGSAFRPWVHVLRRCFRLRPRSELVQILGVLADEITRLIPEMSDTSREHSWELPESRLRLFDAVSTLIRRLSERQPILIVLDDLHRADKPSLLLLESLVSDLRRARLLIVGSHRSAETARDWFRSKAIAGICRHPGCKVLELSGLDESQICDLVSGSLGWEPDSTTVARLQDLTGGNPFFLTQLIQAARFEGAGALLGASLPPTIRDAVLLQIDGLSEATRHFLQMASVIGREFSLSVVEGAQISRADIVGCIDESLMARLIVPIESERES